MLSKSNLNGQEQPIKFQNNNRISKGNLKDYGMSIITGGKTPVNQTNAPQIKSAATGDQIIN